MNSQNTSINNLNSMKSLRDLVKEKGVIICVGSGGVGKTTTSAVIAMQGAMEGLRTLVLTIDPARRLANSMGLSDLTNEPKAITQEQFSKADLLLNKGSLDAMMLDMKQSFDSFVEQFSPDEKTKQKILNNRFYYYFSTSLAGTQEYSAATRLYELYTNENYDLIVLDTPPSVHAIDFLTAPRRLFDAFDNSMLGWFYKSGGKARKIAGWGASYALKTIARFTGAELLDEMGEFLVNFSEMYEGFKERSMAIQKLLVNENTTFIIVTSPQEVTLRESEEMYKVLENEGISVGAVIVNRVSIPFVSRNKLPGSAHDLALRLQRFPVFKEKTNSEVLEFTRNLITNVKQLDLLNELDNHLIGEFKKRVDAKNILVKVPHFPTDIHDLSGLNTIRERLFPSID